MKALILCLAVSFATLGAIAEEHEGRREGEFHQDAVDILDRNIRLDFKLVPQEESDKGVFVVTASSWYQTSVHYESEDGHVTFKVSGDVQIVDDKKIFVTFEAYVAFRGDDEVAEMHVESSALLTPDQDREVASMGDKTLVVRAVYED